MSSGSASGLGFGAEAVPLFPVLLAAITGRRGGASFFWGALVMRAPPL
jgi:hypothetical protein